MIQSKQNLPMLALVAASLLLSACASYRATQPPAAWPDTVVVSERDYELAQCVLHERELTVRGTQALATIIMVNGVPASSRIYEGLATELLRPLNAKVILLDLPGTGRSYLKKGKYSWTRQRQCLQRYLAYQAPHILVVHDIAGPIAIPLVGEVSTIKHLVVLNTIIRPSEFEPVFPMSCMRGCGLLAKPVSYSMPFYLYESRFRELGIQRNEKIDSEQIRAIYDDMRWNKGKGRLVEVMRGFELERESDQKIALGLAHTVPQLFIWGQADPTLGQELLKLPKPASWRAIVRLQQAKHFLMMDYKKEVAQAIVDWYSEQGS